MKNEHKKAKWYILLKIKCLVYLVFLRLNLVNFGFLCRYLYSTTNKPITVKLKRVVVKKREKITNEVVVAPVAQECKMKHHGCVFDSHTRK